MKALILLFALAVFGCDKDPIQPVHPTASSDTLRMEVYSCDFDSNHSIDWKTVTIIVSSTGDSIVLNCGFTLLHTYKFYGLDTTSNHRITPVEDSALVKLRVRPTGDTLRYYIYGVLTPAPYYYYHAADFIITPSHLIKRIWENPFFAPYGLLGDHIYQHTGISVNTIYIP